MMLTWLHLSDFHMGKDPVGQELFCGYILDEIKRRVEQNAEPDLVFITGDLANKGAAEEYEQFNWQFLLPLQEILGRDAANRIFTVPGNHDVDQSKSKTFQRYGILNEHERFFDHTMEWHEEREPLRKRFANFASGDCTGQAGWIDSPDCSYRTVLELKGQRVGILGLNTAWLSEGDLDKDRLTPGSIVVERGLKHLRDCDVRIVLGHHPLDWFTTDRNEADKIRVLFAQSKAFYLHGHLHRSQNRREEGSGLAFTTFQSGAAFQARADEQWVNRMLWCALDDELQYCAVDPLRWSPHHNAWTVDGDAFPPQFRRNDSGKWYIALQPRADEAQPADSAAQVQWHTFSDRKVQIPPGWVVITGEYLQSFDNSLSTSNVLSFFDGRNPGWPEIVSPVIPHRAVVDRVVERVKAAPARRQVSVTLVRGAGGEGKSTVLRQAVVRLAEGANFNVLWHREHAHIDAPLPPNQIVNLPKNIQGSWLIVSDDCEYIAKGILEAVKYLNSKGHERFHFLLCCRDTDWLALGIDDSEWQRHANFEVVELRGLTEEDALLIVDAWSMYDDKGLRDLSKENFDREQAARRLAEVAQKGSRMRSKDGAFLGAMLTVRYGDGFKEHIRSLLRRLDKRPILNSYTLQDAFVYIALMHAKQLPFLSRDVLAAILGYNKQQLMQRVINPLGEEAAVTTSGGHVFTRHEAIARTALDVLVEDEGLDLDEKFILMARTAYGLILKKQEIPDRESWRYIARTLSHQGETQLAVDTARALLAMDPVDSYMIVHLSKMLRRNDQSEDAVSLFRSINRDQRDNRRPYLFEWATAEGLAKNNRESAWLAGVSIADGTGNSDVSRDQAVKSLTGLTIAFHKLFADYNEPAYLSARDGAACLLLRIDPGQERYALSEVGAARANGAMRLGAQALAFLAKGIAVAYQRTETSLPEWVPVGEELSFNHVSRLAKLGQES